MPIPDKRTPAVAAPGTAPALSILQQLDKRITACTRCERLRSYCKGIGETRRKAYRDQEYWAKPVPGFGDERARILILGLAPRRAWS